MTTDEFIPYITKEYDLFIQHTERISAQYTALNDLKTNLPQGHAIVQMQIFLDSNDIFLILFGLNLQKLENEILVSLFSMMNFSCTFLR
jgi:hypothetical protein